MIIYFYSCKISTSQNQFPGSFRYIQSQNFWKKNQRTIKVRFFESFARSLLMIFAGAFFINSRLVKIFISFELLINSQQIMHDVCKAEVWGHFLLILKESRFWSSWEQGLFFLGCHPPWHSKSYFHWTLFHSVSERLKNEKKMLWLDTIFSRKGIPRASEYGPEKYFIHIF